jgi:hypothetical protein
MNGLARPLAFALTVVILGFLAFELAIVIPRMRPEALGVDFHQYLAHTQRWLDGGSLYLERQLQGPYEIQAGDSLYPPPILYLTVPFALGVPQLLWWAIPLTIIAAIAVRIGRHPGPGRCSRPCWPRLGRSRSSCTGTQSSGARPPWRLARSSAGPLSSSS